MHRLSFSMGLSNLELVDCSSTRQLKKDRSKNFKDKKKFIQNRCLVKQGGTV